MHKGDRARFLREAGGDTFCFVITSNVKTLIEIMKYSFKVDKIFLKYILQVISLASFTLLMSMCQAFAPFSIETVNKSHFHNVFYLFLHLLVYTTMHFESLSILEHHALSNHMAGSAILEIC